MERESYPTWHPDLRHVAFAGGGGVYVKAANGTGEAELVGPSAGSPTSFSPDGKRLLFHTGTTPRDIGIIHLESAPRTELLIHTTADEQNAVFSPDGRWLAYESNESGRAEVYVRPFPQVDAGRWQISFGGGTRPVWARNGRELFYYVAPGRIMTVRIRTGSDFVAENPQMVFEGQYVTSGNGPVYDVSPDGRRFLLIKAADAGNSQTLPQLIVAINWLAELKQRFSAN
jgi:eukaryotic-like serine/threonine-protein kinase